jgi:hypothetical protein
MNCQDFESIVLDLARGEVGSAAEAARGQAHAAVCAPCAALLSEQRNLTLGFEALASQAKEAQAPERVEAALRLKFRNRDAAAARRPFRQRRDPAQTWTPHIFRSRLAWAMAAVVVAAVSIAIAARLRVKPNATPLVDRPSQAQSHPPTMTITPYPGESALDSGRPSQPRQTQTAAINAESLRHHQATHRVAARKLGGRRAPAPSQSANDEAMTAFYPLPYGSGLGLDEGWELVRVRMAVSALASLGIPVTDEPPSAQFVKADVVLGEDGMARAIRFVQ